MEVVKIGHFWSEDPGFKISRPEGVSEYLVIHFWESFEIVLDGRTVTTEPHACIIYKMGTPQFFGNSETSTQDWFRIVGDVEAVMQKYGLRFNTLYYPKNYEFITDLTRKMEVEFTNKKSYYLDVCEAYLSEFFALLAREIANQSKTDINSETKEQLKVLRQRLQHQYYRKWDIEDMANAINLSPSYFHASYKRFFGISPMRDLISIRIEQAKTMLSDSKRTVNEIAALCGYSNPSTFIRQFTKNVGLSPFKYRQRNHLDNRSHSRFK